MDLDDRLEVRVVSAEGLREVEGGECNPFAVVQVGLSSSSLQTGVVHGTTKPRWNEERMVFSSLSENGIFVSSFQAVVTVWHKSQGAGADSQVGRAAVDLTTCVLAPGVEIDESFDLDTGGSIRLEMVYFVGDGEDLFDTDDEYEEQDAEKTLPNMLVGSVSRGRGLRAARDRAVDGDGLVDCYVTTRIFGTSRKAKTGIVKKTAAPVFGKNEIRLPCDDGRAEVLVKAKQRLTLKNELLGEARLPLVEIARHGDDGLTKWCQLTGPGGSLDGDRGSVQVSLKWIHDAKYARSLRRALREKKKLASSSSSSKVDQIGPSFMDNPVPVLSSTDMSATAVDETTRVFFSTRHEERELASLFLAAEEEALEASRLPRLTTREREAAEERREASTMMAERAYEDRMKPGLMPAGDYQIQVHVIEARDLKAEDYGGTSDPYARVKCLGKVKKTRVQKKVTSCLFGDTLYFNLDNLTAAEIERATVDVAVLDYDSFSAHDVIGAASFDCAKIHSMDGHELYRKWVGLVDPSNDSDTGYQGYLKVSITVLGPDDEQLTHDPDREYQDELRDAEKKGSDGVRLDDSALAESLPAPTLKFLVLSVFAAADIPTTGRSGYALSSSTAAAETKVKATFAGVACETAAVRVAGAKNTCLAPEFRQELWIPVSEPTQASVVKIALLDAKRRDQVVAAFGLPYREIPRLDDAASSKAAAAAAAAGFFGSNVSAPRGQKKKTTNEKKPRWYHLYGADLGAAGTRTTYGSAADVQNRYGSDKGSAYRGRLLMSAKVVDAKAAPSSSRHKSTPHVRPVSAAVDLRALQPVHVPYVLKMLLVSGSELPVVRARGSTKSASMRIVASIGRREALARDHRASAAKTTPPDTSTTTLGFEWQANTRGVVEWNEVLTARGEFPAAVDDVPDLCLALEAKHPHKTGPGRSRTVAYARIPAAKLLKTRFDQVEPEWYALEREPGVALAAQDAAPGAILAKIGFALRQDALDPDLAWPSDADVRKPAADVEPCCLRVFVYQAKNLPAGDDDGQLDAYVKVRFRGEKQKTKVASKTTAPLFYETLQFASHMLPKDPRYGPDVVLQVWDYDRLGANSAAAVLRLPLTECARLSSEGAAPPTPAWRPLTDATGRRFASDASLLVSAGILTKAELADKVDRPPNITPQFRTAFLDVTCVGVRQLKGFYGNTLRPPKMPQLRGDLCAPNDGDTYFKTKPAATDAARTARQLLEETRQFEDQGANDDDDDDEALDDDDDDDDEEAGFLGRTTNKRRRARASSRRKDRIKLEKGGRNANFCERKVVAVELPENPLYAQHLDLRVYDAGRAGTPLLGYCSVDLAPKLPWNSEDYEPPQNELYDDVEARKRAQRARRAAEARKRAKEALQAAAADDDGGGAFGDRDEQTRDGPGSKQQRVGVSFGDDDRDGDDDDDDEGPDEGDAEPQYELERRTEAPRDRPSDDDGVGAFEPMHFDELPMILEDQVYAEAEKKRLEAEEAEALRIERGASRTSKKVDRRTLAQRALGLVGLDAELEAALVGEETYKLSELGLEFPTQWAAADYLIGRDWWIQKHGSELERYLKTKPFETYTLSRGKYATDPRKRTLKTVGVFKAVIRVCETDPAADALVPPQALKPRLYAVRVYCIKAQNLQPVDGDSADPYLRVKLGSQQTDARPRTKRLRTLNPDLYQTYEFVTTLPGPSVLKVQLKDWNRFSPVHALVGETKIDLEDRWFHKEWQSLGALNEFGAPIEQGANPYKPIEVRNLYNPATSSVVQGQVHMWVEIRPVADTRRDPPVEFVEPPRREFQVRVICWKTKAVPKRMGDFYCKFVLGSSRAQSTDVHWRCQTGRASWNWRVKIPITLPAASPEQCRLAIQLWDQQVIKWNDVVGSATIDLYRWFLQAYRENRPVDVFKEINDALKRLKAQEQGIADDDDLDQDSDDDDDDDDDENATLLEGDDDHPDDDTRAAAANDDDDDVDLEAADAKRTKKKKKKKTKPSPEEENEAEELDPLAEETGETAEKTEAEYFVQEVKNMMGLGDLDDSAQWIPLTYHDHKRHRIRDRGAVAISVEILPKEDADLRPAGHGISSPNSNPTLPPRTGRLSLSLNPFYLLSAFCGPEVAATLFICACLALFLFIWFYCGLYYTNFYYELESFSSLF